MFRIIESFPSFIDLGPDELIGGLALALLLALPVGLIHTLGRGRAKAMATPLIAVTAIVNAAAMVVAFQHGHPRYGREPGRASDGGQLGPQSGTPRLPPLGRFLAERIFPSILLQADADGDRRLSRSEVHAAVDTFLGEAARDGDDAIDGPSLVAALASSLEERLRPPIPSGTEPQPSGGKPATTRES